jgi:hypothetical protein
MTIIPRFNLYSKKRYVDDDDDDVAKDPFEAIKINY